MNHIRLFVALVAACILVMPALSMPNKEMGQDGNQKQCDGDNSLKDFEHKWQGQDSKENPSDCQKPMMGEDGQKHIKSMMGDKKKESNGEVKIVIINVNA